MLRNPRFKVAAATAVAGASLVAAGTAWTTASASRPRPRPPAYGQAELQADLDAITAVGATGVHADVRTDGRRLRGTSGVAYVATGAAIDPAGYFRMGSNTKTFVAVVVLQLVGEGRLGLDDPVEKFLPGVVAGNGNDGRAVTVRQLLNHTSGLHDYTDDLVAEIDSTAAYQKIQFKEFTREQLIAQAMSSPPYFAPGQGWNYSNTNYVLAGLVIEKLTGHPWGTEVRNRILRPLGLGHTSVPGRTTTVPAPHAHGYLYIDDFEHPYDATEQSMTWVESAGSLITTAADLSRFWAAIGRGLVLRPAQNREMRRTVAAQEQPDPEPGLKYGLGIEWRPLSCGGGFWGHGGDVPGFTTVDGVSADGRTTVVVSLSTAAVDEMHAKAYAVVDHAICNR
jgi:D-alanyl-D-alanine carboxypeptidase